MTITFESIIKQNGEDNQIKFTSEVEITDYHEFTAYEFREPQDNVMNRIEVADDKINIFAGPATINLSLNNEVSIPYATPQGVIHLVSMMDTLERKEDHEHFKYTLSNNGEAIGEYKITLSIKK